MNGYAPSDGRNGDGRNHDWRRGGAAADGGELGMVVSGSLTDGVAVRLDAGVSVEDVKVGTLVSVQGSQTRFLGTLTGVELGSSDPTLASSPPDVSNPLVAEALAGTAAYGTITVEPTLALGVGGAQPAKTIPPHFARASAASEDDVALVFGEEGDGRFHIGNPMDMEAKLCLNIDELVKRSNGVFGKSGTGKTYLTRLLLIGILQRGEAANLIFDMHGEYGWRGSSEHMNEVKGLKQLFGSRVAVFSLDPESARRRGLQSDYDVRIGCDDIEPEDVAVIADEWNLSDVAVEATYTLERRFGGRWISALADLDAEGSNELARELNIPHSTLSALRNRLSRLRRFDFVVDGKGGSAVNEMLAYINDGRHVVLEFGRYGNDIGAYLLVANMLTRRVHKRYVELSERASGGAAERPRPLVITIEEAHKFLSPAIAKNTIFGSIAREMRKYNVTLLVVDQRPSGIDEEVMSQLGTKIACLLDNERDADAVLSGVSGSRKLRTALSRLESNRQALAFGHALPMPVVMQTREYGSAESYRELGFSDASELRARAERDTDLLFGAAPGRGG